MTVHTQNVVAGPYIGDGVSNIFTFNFKILNAQYLEVRANDIVLTLHTDYEVSFSGEAGQITLTAPLAVDVELFIIRTTPITQEHDYVQGDSFPAESHEGALDKLTLIAQEVSERMDRAILTHIGDEGGEVFPSKAQRANTLLGFDSNSAAQAVSMGNGVELAGTVLKVKIGDTLIFQNGGINLNPFVVAEISAATQGVSDLDSYTSLLNSRITLLELESSPNRVQLGGGLAFDGNGRLGIYHDDTLSIENSILGLSGPFRDRLVIGEFGLMPFRATELPAGWYVRNGDKFLLSSPQGQALNNLPENYKVDWGIVITNEGGSDYINVPTAFHTDGRSYFDRAVDGVTRQVGSVEGDAIRNITGTFSSFSYAVGQPNGAFTSVIATQNALAGGSTANYNDVRKTFSASSAGVPTAAENRVLNRGLTPVIFLGV